MLLAIISVPTSHHNGLYLLFQAAIYFNYVAPSSSEGKRKRTDHQILKCINSEDDLKYLHVKVTF